MLSLGPSSSFYAERMPFTTTSFPSSFAINPRNNTNNRSHVPNEATAATIIATSGLYSNFPQRTLRPSSQISKLCPFPYRKEKEDERRRQAFLRKVRDVGDARKWEQRGDTILRIDYVSGQKQWEEQQVKAAPQPPVLPEDEEMELKAEVSRSEDAEIIDEMLHQERQEFEALVGLFENGSCLGEQETHKTDYGSEDEEFNRDCLQVLWASETSRPTRSRSAGVMTESYVPMDMSID